MSLTELAFLPLHSSASTSSTSTSLLDPTSPLYIQLHHALSLLTLHSGHKFRLFRALPSPSPSTDPTTKLVSQSTLILIGAWHSLSHHHSWLVSEENLELLRLFKSGGTVDVDRIEMFHVGVEGGVVSDVVGGVREGEEKGIWIERVVVRDDVRGEGGEIEEVKAKVKEGGVGGWRVDGLEGTGRREWVGFGRGAAEGNEDRDKDREGEKEIRGEGVREVISRSVWWALEVNLGL